MTMNLPDQLIGYRLFTDAAKRAIYQQTDGRQYVVDDDGKKEYGVWLIPGEEPDLPIILPAEQ